MVPFMELTGFLDLYSGLCHRDNYNVSSARMNLLPKLGVLMRNFICLARCFAFSLLLLQYAGLKTLNILSHQRESLH